MTVGIYTIHADVNYGAMLQAFATQKFLLNHGIDAEIVNLLTKDEEYAMHYKIKCNSIKNVVKRFMAELSPKTKKKIRRIESFHQSMKLSKRYYSLDEIYNIPPNYDIHLVGSDQVWNMERGLKTRNYFFLDFLSENKVRMSYASSLGNPDISLDLYPSVKKLLEPFGAISTREEEGAKVLSTITGRDVAQVVDPTLLLSADEWMNETIQEPIIKGKYILYYGFDKSQQCKEMIDALKGQLNIPVIAVAVTQTIPYRVDKFIRDAGPREFLNLFKYATYVISSSFHGLAFAIIFRRNFFVISHGSRMSRMESLLESFNIVNRIVSSKAELIYFFQKSPVINYKALEYLINYKINYSKRWLLDELISK